MLTKSTYLKDAFFKMYYTKNVNSKVVENVNVPIYYCNFRNLQPIEKPKYSPNTCIVELCIKSK